MRRLRWLGRLRLMGDASKNNMYQANLRHKRPKWKHDVEKDIREMGIFNWRQIEKDRDVWRRENGEVFSVLGYWSQSIITRIRIRKMEVNAFHCHSRKGVVQLSAHIYEELMQDLWNIVCLMFCAKLIQRFRV